MIVRKTVLHSLTYLRNFYAIIFQLILSQYYKSVKYVSSKFYAVQHTKYTYYILYMFKCSKNRTKF